MTVPPRGVRSRRSGRRPGWLLLSALLVLAILASSTLVFTNRVELLRLAVILSLWAAVLAAFVSVTYRRQSQLDEARARDMKFVYDLQLDREISARREYELSVEAHLRRQLGHELRAQAADEMAALRSELMSLRSHLEALLGADLGDRPALESDRVAEPLSMPMPPPPGRVESSRVTEVITEEVTTRVEVVEEVVEQVVHEVTTEHPIIDVPEEPLMPASPPPPPRVAPPPPPPPPAPPEPPVAFPPRSADAFESARRRPEPPLTPWRPPETETRRGRHWTPDAAPGPRPSAFPAAEPTAQPAPAAHQQPGSTTPPRGRHWNNPASDVDAAADALGGRHRDADEPAPDAPQGQHTGGHSVADLLARLDVDGRSGGGGRRRRED